MRKIFMTVIAIMMTTSLSAQFYIYLSNGDVLKADSISTVAPSMPNPPAPSLDGMLSGKFSVSDTTQVQFSQGNLQATYDGSAWTWSFATNQWDYIGNAASNNTINGNGTVSSNGTVDLFGWSTTATYYGINNSEANSTYSGVFVDWGNNSITNGGNTTNLWRTLTKDEWRYLFRTRADAGNKYGAAKVNGIPGVVLLPDNWTLPSGCGFTAGMTNASPGDGWSLVAYTNIYDVDHWSKMEKAGAVFLPVAGHRDGLDVYFGGSEGHYWYATLYSANYAYVLYFSPSYIDPLANDRRCRGQSVRLVH